jgi:hypothetical protein
MEQQDNLKGVVMDLSLSLIERLSAFETYYEIVGVDTIELISILTGMYQFSGTSILKNFLYKLCTHGKVPSFIKLEAAKSLLSFMEDEDDYDDDEGMLILMKKRNVERMKIGYKALDCVCYDLGSMPMPCQIEAVCLLMKNIDYMIFADIYFREIISNILLECDFRYKTILSLENKDIDESKFFIGKACMEFLFLGANMTMYRILASQYILQKLEPSEADVLKVCEQVLSFANDEDLDYNLRADAADLLLNLGTDEMKIKGRHIIEILGRIHGESKTVFGNAQNVHVEEIEESVLEMLEYLVDIPIQMIEGEPITFGHVNGRIEYLMKQEKNIHTVNGHVTKCAGHCECCEVCITSVTNCDEIPKYCSNDCLAIEERHDKIRISLNRIVMDRVLYSKYNNSLINILLKMWSFIKDNEYEEQLHKRLLEELFDMSGTCSSGFASRLVNVMSGFSQFNIRISWKDQIASNFNGRMNALINHIKDSGSPYMNGLHRDVVEIWLNCNTDVLDKVKLVISNGVKVVKNNKGKPNLIPMTKIVDEYLTTNRDDKVENCVDSFYDEVISEMSENTTKWGNRQNYLLFFRTSMLSVREEMYGEFKDLISDDMFDLYIREAISVYDGVKLSRKDIVY